MRLKLVLNCSLPVVGLVVLASGAASAQTLELPRPRQGYFLSAGLYGAATQIWDDGEAEGVWGGTAFTLRVGEMLTSRLGLGLELHFGGTAREAQSASFGGLGLQGQWEMLDNFALRGGVGLAVIGLSDDREPDADLEGVFGAGYMLGLSYDWFFSKHQLSGGWALTPSVAVRYVPGDPVQGMVGLFGLEITYFSGRPANQLELPAGEGYKR